MLTDTHTHLYSEAFSEDRDKMMQRAIEAGVNRFFIPASNSGSFTHHCLGVNSLNQN